jgi:hypothetical protein
MKVKIHLTETALFFSNLLSYRDESDDASKYQLAGRVPGWKQGLFAGSKPLSGTKAKSTSQPSIVSAVTSSTSSSKLTRGSTISDGPFPLTPGLNIAPTDAGDDVVGHSVSKISELFEESDMDENIEREESLTRIRNFEASSAVSPPTHSVIWCINCSAGNQDFSQGLWCVDVAEHY